MFKTILVPVDPAEPAFAQDALKTAVDLAKAYDADVRLLAVMANVQGYVADYLPEGFEKKATADTQAMIDKMADEVGMGEKASGTVRHGSVYHEVIEEAGDCGADLVVMTSHKPSFSTYLIGSNAAHIVRHAPCSVMVLRPKAAE